MRQLWAILFISTFLGCVVCPPVDGKKKTTDEGQKGNAVDEVDDFGLSYGRYLQQVVQLLEEDKDFAKKLENVSADQIRSGDVAKELEFVQHNIRTKLDELKRIEVDRLRKYVQEQMERSELGLYRDEDGRVLESPDGRRWRTIPGHQGGAEGGVGGGGDFWLGINRKGLKLPQHVDLRNPHSFEVDDLKKLIQTATKDLEELDKQRREEFKKYEMEKEMKYRDSLKNMTEDQRSEAEKHHQEMLEKHKDHPKVHHPGSKPQLEQVWEEEDHLPKDEFNPRTFFAMHDLNGDGHLDEKEVEAILLPEVKKMYDPKNEEDDPTEMEEEYHRMREHIFNETDRDKDGLISLEEFIKMTQQQDFQQDEGWKGLDEQNVYSEAELEEYMRQRHMQMGMQYPYYADPRLQYDVPNAHGLPPQVNYQVPPQQLHPGMQQQYQQQQFQQQQHPQNGMHPQQVQGMHPQQGQGMHPQQGQGMHPQQGQGMHPQQGQGMHPQQQFQGHHPQQQQFQGMNPQQQQFQGMNPQQQQFQGMNPQQQQVYQGVPQQHFQGGNSQQFGVPPQQVQGSPQAQVPHQAPAPPQQAQANQPPKPSVDTSQSQASSLPNVQHVQQSSPPPPVPSQQQQQQQQQPKP